MTPAEELRRLIKADARNVEYATSRRKVYDAYMHASVIADCAKRYVEARAMPKYNDIELDAWENLVRALEGWR